MKEKKALFLLEELSGISDGIISAAYDYPARAKRRRLFLRRFAVAAVAVLVFAVALNIRGHKNEVYDTVPNILCNAEAQQIESVSIGETNKLVWRTSDGRLYQKSISVSDFVRLSDMIGYGSSADPDYDAGIDGLWLVSSDGDVRSPYLQNNCGNFAIGDIFDYSPEVIPSDSFVSALKKAID